MASDWPRTEKVIIHGMELYHATRHRHGEGGADPAVQCVACQVVAAFDAVIRQPAVLPENLREVAYRWLFLAPRLDLTPAEIETRLDDVLRRRAFRHLP